MIWNTIAEYIGIRGTDHLGSLVQACSNAENLIYSSKDLSHAIEKAKKWGWTPDLFQQSVYSGYDGHLRLKRSDCKEFGRISSEVLDDGSVQYSLYVPKCQSE
jgi:hypothetical protein